MFYKDSHVALLVYDITQRKTFIELKEFWIKELHSNAPQSVIIFIIANKNDLFESEEVTEEEGRKFAEEQKAFFSVVSAKNSFGINELFDTIGEKHLAEYWKNNEEVLKEIERRKEIRKQSVRINQRQSAKKPATSEETTANKRCC